jgi:hypothetical protein
MKSLGVTEELTGIAIHDAWSSPLAVDKLPAT